LCDYIYDPTTDEITTACVWNSGDSACGAFDATSAADSTACDVTDFFEYDSDTTTCTACTYSPVYESNPVDDSGTGDTGAGTDDTGAGTDDTGTGTDDTGTGTDDTGTGTDDTGNTDTGDEGVVSLPICNGCLGIPNEGICANNTNCTWNSDSDMCEFTTPVAM